MAVGRPITEADRESVAALTDEGLTPREISEKTGLHYNTVLRVRKGVRGGDTAQKKTPVSIQRRYDRIRALAHQGFSKRQIAAKEGIHITTVTNILQRLNIEATALYDQRTRIPDPNRVITQMVIDAENLTADVTLIEFEKVDPSKYDGWIRSLQRSRQQLTAFIQRLTQEKKRHGENSSDSVQPTVQADDEPQSVQDPPGPDSADASADSVGGPEGVSESVG